MGNYGVMNQKKRTTIIEPKVRLVTCSENLVSTIFIVWHGSRYNTMYTHEEINNILKLDESEYDDNLQKLSTRLSNEYGTKSGKEAIVNTVNLCISMNLPITESIHFTFEVDEATVAWRDQLVRHRQAGIWVQTSRTRDARTIDIALPKSVETYGGDKGVEIYKDLSNKIRLAYEELIKLGVPQEDIRLQPGSSVHKVYFFVTLRTLVTIIKKRTSWIAQASLWTPIISQILDILDKKGIGKFLSTVRSDNGAKISRRDDGTLFISEYNFEMDAYHRYNGEDPLPVDPLYLAYKNLEMPEHTDLKMYNYMKSQFINIWSDEYLEILGWDKNNPNKLGYYDK